jgi:acetyltransferase-like isoleucine patch superfamily enzyme
MDIGKNCRISWKAHLDKSVNPKGIHIGDNTWILNGAMILAHDHCRGLKADTYIGSDCVIGVRSIVMPGITIGNQSVVGGGSVVTKDISCNCIAVGNPAKVIKEGVSVRNGQIQN